MNSENLRSLAEVAPEELKAISRRGGLSSGAKRRERKKLREELELLLSSEDRQQKICTALIDKASRGDWQAFRTIRDSIGEAPEQIVGLYRAEDGKTLEEIRTDPEYREELRDLYVESFNTGKYRKLLDLLMPSYRDRMDLMNEIVNHGESTREYD